MAHLDDSAGLGADELVVLSAVLRARPATVEELARQVQFDGPRLENALGSLAERGMVELDGVRLGVVAPDVSVKAAASVALDRQRRQLDEFDEMLRALPALLRDWSVGEGGDATIPVELVHGTSNQWELWMRLMGEMPPRAPIAVFPDFAGLATIVVENLDVLVHAKESLGFTLRTITVPSALADERERRQLALFGRAGVEIRTLPVVPGWFYVDAGVLAALPLAWGEAVPSSIALVRDPAFVAPLAAFMEGLWARSNPVPGSSGGWDAVLALLAQGLSDGAIASALDTSVRTVRRRISDAADTYGVTTRFGLGVEWQRSRRGGMMPEEEPLAGIAREIDTQRASLARLATRLDSLPSVARAQRLAHESPGGSTHVDILHGPEAQWEFWIGLLTQTPPRAPVAVFPDFGQLITLVATNLGLERSAALGQSGMRSRVITEAGHLTEPTVRASMVTFASTGIEVRTVAATPGWFYADETLAVVPTDWASPAATSLVITRDIAVVAALRAYFDELWDRALSLTGSAAGWDAVLSLLAQGMSDGAIALTLGQSLRTVRRRIAEASEAFGAASRFALGVEWERSRQG